MTTGRKPCILRSKGSSLHSFVYPLASVRAVWLRCGLKWRDFCINVKALTQKGSPFLRPPKGDTVHEAGKEHLGTISRGAVPETGLPGDRPITGGCGAPFVEIRCQRTARRQAKECLADFSGAVCGFSGVDPHSGRRHLRLHGGRGEHDRHSGGHHHERNSGHRSDRQGLRIAGQPEADVRSHRQGTAGRSDRTDPRSRGGSR